ncbi:MAG: hypothetical protein ABIF71_01780 [Planctomycetota bacterium]
MAHYIIPDTPEIFLDVMGCPPRVPDFDAALAGARVMQTPWGNIPTIGIKDLAALKTTQRLGDYQVIGQLVMRFLEEQPTASPDDYRWAIDHTHTLDDTMELLTAYPHAAAACEAHGPIKALAAGLQQAPPGPDRATRNAAEDWLNDRMSNLRRADRDHWQAIIAELRKLKTKSSLMPAGEAVSSEQISR